MGNDFILIKIISDSNLLENGQKINEPIYVNSCRLVRGCVSFSMSFVVRTFFIAAYLKEYNSFKRQEILDTIIEMCPPVFNDYCEYAVSNSVVKYKINEKNLNEINLLPLMKFMDFENPINYNNPIAGVLLNTISKICIELKPHIPKNIDDLKNTPYYNYGIIKYYNISWDISSTPYVEICDFFNIILKNTSPGIEYKIYVG